MSIEKLQTASIHFDGRPGIGFNRLGEIQLEILFREAGRQAIKAFRNPPHGKTVSIDGSGRLSVPDECVDVSRVELIEFGLLGLVHDDFVVMPPGVGWGRK